MDTQRLILFVIFSFSALFLWERWQAEHRPPPSVPSQSAPKSANDTPAPSTGTPPAAGAPNIPGGPSGEVPKTGEKVTIKTDRYVASVDTLGGVIKEVALTQHRDTDNADKPYLLLQKNENRTFVAQTGLIGESLPNHHTLWQALPGARELAPGAETLELKLTAGDKVTQTLTFHRGSYVIDVSFDVTNAGPAPITPAAYFQFARDGKSTGVQSWGAPSAFNGPVLYNEADKYKKIDFADIDKGKAKFTDKTDNGWIGMVEHYFVAAWLPSDAKKLPREFYVNKLDNLYYDGVKVRVLRQQARQPLPRRRQGSARQHRARRRRTHRCATLRRPAGAGYAEDARQRPRPGRRLRRVHRHRRAPVLSAQVAAFAARQLGLGDHRDDRDHQERVLSA